MNRVLLYEPMLHGHRGVLLNYYRRALENAGYSTVLCTDMLPEHNSPDLVDALESLAKARDCGIIHVLTFERLGPIWLKYTKQFRRRGRPIIASYYLYNNLYGMFRGLPWDLLVARGLLARLLVSDDFLEERPLPRWRRGVIDYVPDPWDPRDFQPMERGAAKDALGIPTDRKMLLVIGALKPRKGLELLFNALLQGDRNESRLLLVLAGVLDPYFRVGSTAATISTLQERGLLRIDDGYLEESRISVYFHAADVVVCPYPRSFKASSNVYTRACAAGTLAIVPNHGILGELVRRTGAGLSYRSEDAVDLACCIYKAISPEFLDGAHGKIIEAEHCLAARKSIEYFNQAVRRTYARVTAKI